MHHFTTVFLNDFQIDFSSGWKWTTDIHIEKNAAASIWSKLRLEIHSSSSFASFQRNLKTYYFCRAFS